MLKDPIVTKWTTNPLSKEFINMLNRYFQQNVKFFEAKKIYDYIYIKKRTDGSACKIVIIIYSLFTLAYQFNRLYKEYSKDKVLHYITSIFNIKKAEAR